MISGAENPAAQYHVIAFAASVVTAKRFGGSPHRAGRGRMKPSQPIPAQSEHDASASEEAGREGPHQLEALVSLALLLGGIALLVHSEGSAGKLIGGTALVLFGLFALVDVFRSWRRRGRGLPVNRRSVVTRLVIYPILLLLCVVALLAPIAVAFKLVKSIWP